jgi:hypothetical protein
MAVASALARLQLADIGVRCTLNNTQQPCQGPDFNVLLMQSNLFGLCSTADAGGLYVQLTPTGSTDASFGDLCVYQQSPGATVFVGFLQAPVGASGAIHLRQASP